MTYRELQTAVAVLGLGERATWKEIKSRHRQLVKKHHPDAGRDADADEMRRINAAYLVLSDYLSEYRFSFHEEEFYQQNPEERLRRQFMDAALWGTGDSTT